jgi:hypothetical protein
MLGLRARMRGGCSLLMLCQTLDQARVKARAMPKSKMLAACQYWRACMSHVVLSHAARSQSPEPSRPAARRAHGHSMCEQ